MFSKILTASALSRKSDEDLTSQLNHIWTTSVLAGIGFMITMVQFAGDPIQCWCPAQMPESHCNYTKALCWIKDNYYVDKNTEIQFKEEDRGENLVAYYPWVPWILFAMAFGLKLPHMIWQSFMPSSGMNLNKLISLADTDDSMTNLAKVLRIWLVRTHRAQKNVFSKAKKNAGSIGLFCFGRNNRTYLCGLTLAVKWAYFLTTTALFFLVNVFIQEDFLHYGFEVIDSLVNGYPRSSATFPKNTICDFKIRQMQNVHTYSVQCVLPINMYNEYVFIFVWFWFVFLIIVNASSLFKWCFYLLSPYKRREYIKHYAAVVYRIQKEKKRLKAIADANANSASPDPRPVSGATPGPNGATSLFGGARPTYDNIPRVRRWPRFETMASVDESGGVAVRVARPSKIQRGLSEKDMHKKLEKGEKERLRELTLEEEKQIDKITNRMIKHIGHDGVVVFRSLETGVGVVIANQIFQELYEQLTQVMHYL